MLLFDLWDRLYVGALVPVPEVSRVGLEENALLVGGDDLPGPDLLVSPVLGVTLLGLAGRDGCHVLGGFGIAELDVVDATVFLGGCALLDGIRPLCSLHDFLPDNL